MQSWINCGPLAAMCGYSPGPVAASPLLTLHPKQRPDTVRSDHAQPSTTDPVLTGYRL